MPRVVVRALRSGEKLRTVILSQVACTCDRAADGLDRAVRVVHVQQTSETGSRRRRTALTTAVISIVAIAIGFGAGLAVVGLDLLPDNNDANAARPASVESGTCPDGSESGVLRIAAATEIAPALRGLAASGGQLEESLRCREIEITSAPPREIRAALSRGWVESTDGPPPHVWIPTTSTEVALTRATSAASDTLPDDPTSIARSPTVIAMPQPMAEAIGWPDADVSWNAIAKLTASDDAWAERGHEDWGPFRLSLVEGVESEPSMTSVAALIRAVGALPSGPSPEGETSAEEFEARAQLLLLERRVEYLGETTEAQLDQLREADANDELLQTVSALPLTEQQAWLFNQGGPEQRDPPRTPLAVWYPDDGGPDADYPYAVLDAPWSEQSTTVAAAAFLDLLQSTEGQQRLQRFGFRDSSRQATPQLGEQNTIRPDTAPPEPERMDVAMVGPVLQAWRGLSQTGNLLSVLDVSGSMKTEVPGTGASRLELSIQGSIAGLQLLDPNTISGLWEFSTEIGPNGEDYRELVPLGPLGDEVNGRPRLETVVERLQGLRPREDTGLYDTIAAAYEHLLDNHEPGRINALVIFTDGKNDDDDGMSLQQLQARLRELVDPERQVLILAVGYGPEADFEALNAVTSVTDGKLYALDRPEDIRNVFIDVQTGGVN
jgi:Ca-activated chloride channel family protein